MGREQASAYEGSIGETSRRFQQVPSRESTVRRGGTDDAEHNQRYDRWATSIPTRQGIILLTSEYGTGMYECLSSTQAT